jgi:hypothetical protein
MNPMTRNLLLCGAFALVAALAVCAQPVSADNAMMAATVNISGTWNVQATGNEFKSGKLYLTQRGNTIVGYYGASKQGQISGTMVSGGKVNGNWKSPGGAGWLTLHVTSNGNGFSGTWGYNGKKSNGSIVGTKAS